MKKFNVYFKLCKNNILFILVGLLFLIFETIIAIKIPFIMNKVNEYLFNLNNNIINFVNIFFIFIGVYILDLILNYITTIIFKIIGIKNTTEISKNIMDKIYYSTKNQSTFKPGYLLEVFNKDTFVLGEKGLLYIYQIIYITINIIALFYYMWKTNILIAILITFIFILLILIQKIINSKVTKEINIVKDCSGEYSYIITDFIQKNNEYRRIDCYNYFSNLFNSKLNLLLKNSFKLDKIVSINYLINGFIGLINISIIFLLGAFFINKGFLLVSELITFNIYANKFGAYILQIPSILVNLKGFSTSCNRISKVLKMHTYKDNNDIIPLNTINKIQLCNVSFSYKNSENYIIYNFNYDFFKGNIYCIVGKNGAGKSTLISLLVGEYPINNGAIIINNNVLDIYQNKFELDKHICLFSSNSILFNDTFMNNITLDNKKYDKQKVNQLCDLTNISDWVNNQKDRLNTMIDTLKGNFSDGQKQKISLIRCLLKNKEILVFDELEKHLDSETKNNVITYLNEIKNDKIIIISSHDEHIKAMSDFVLEL